MTTRPERGRFHIFTLLTYSGHVPPVWRSKSPRCANVTQSTDFFSQLPPTESTTN
ncbi:hypothetical protein J6590_094716 [Homalodisca vitripennis]|nr:hypothetical protein J6590_094716 [Homalodisca vitripennis]